MQPINGCAHLWLLAFPLPPSPLPPPPTDNAQNGISFLLLPICSSWYFSYCCQPSWQLLLDIPDVAKTHFCVLLDTKTVENLIFLKPLLLVDANLIFFKPYLLLDANLILKTMSTTECKPDLLQTMSATECKPNLLQPYLLLDANLIFFKPYLLFDANLILF